MSKSPAKPVAKLVLSLAENIPFNKLKLAQANVRRTKLGVSIEHLAEDIAHRTLLQSINVRAELDANGEPTGLYEIPAGGRRYRALELLVKQKRLAKTAPVPCVIRTDGIAVEDSLAENVHREQLHPLDQFRAFQELIAEGLSEAEIAARFFVPPAIVKQRLRLATVAPELQAAYAADEMILEQLMAFTVSDDHQRQIEVWTAVNASGRDLASDIRRLLTENTVPVSDPRAAYVGKTAYVAAGGHVYRDLFSTDTDCYFQDVPLLERLVAEKLAAARETLLTEGWQWVETAVSFPYSASLRQIPSSPIQLTHEQKVHRSTIEDQLNALDEQYDYGETLDETDQARHDAVRAELESFDREDYDPADVARAGAFISLDRNGSLVIRRGYLRPDPVTPSSPKGLTTRSTTGRMSVSCVGNMPGSAATNPSIEATMEDDPGEALKPLSERLITELSSYMTLALREAVANNPRVAMTALLHSLCLNLFNKTSGKSCLAITAVIVRTAAEAPDLATSGPAQALDAVQQMYEAILPKTSPELWHTLDQMSEQDRLGLLAFCTAQTIDAHYQQPNAWNPSQGRADHAATLAQAVRLDIAATGWTPTVANYLDRVPRPRILEAIREAKGDQSGLLIAHLKKADMAREAARMLAGTGWLPEPLRVPRDDDAADEPSQALPDFLAAE